MGGNFLWYNPKGVEKWRYLFCLAGCIYRYVTKLTRLGSRLVRGMESYLLTPNILLLIIPLETIARRVPDPCA